MIKDTIEFYTAFLTDVGFKIDDDGVISKYSRKKNGVSWLPIKADGNPLVMGTKERLDAEDDGSIIYHPLTEDALKGESYTIKVTKDQINAMTRMRFIGALLGLGKALVEKRNAKVTPKQTKLFNLNPNFDETALTALTKILSRAKSSVVSRHVLGVYLHSKNCTFEGHDVKRLAKVSSALYDTLDKGDKEIWGVKNVTIKAQKAIKQLMDTVLPGVNDDAYSHGSNNKTAPYFDSIANAFLNISYQLDSIETTCKTLFNDELIDSPKYEWVSNLPNLVRIAMPIPPLRGNMGNEIMGNAAFDVPKHEATINETSKPKVNKPKVNTPQVDVSEESTHPMFRNKVAQPVQQTFHQPMRPQAPQQQQSSTHPLFNNNGGGNMGSQPGAGSARRF